MKKYQHIPVMLEEVLEYLNLNKGQNIIDCTLGGGGYTFEISKRVHPGGQVMAIDLDKEALQHADSILNKQKISNIILAHGNFANLQKIVEEYWPEEQAPRFGGIVFDLGLSMDQLKDRSRGFSFQLDAPLEMSFGHQAKDCKSSSARAIKDRRKTTDYIVNKFKKDELYRIIRDYGEERYWRRIANEVVDARKEKYIKTTKELVEIIERAVPGEYKRKKIHFATRTFQALRIATNNELQNIEMALPQAVDLLDRGGRMVVVSYHSLEDRIVKNFFREMSKDCACPEGAMVCNCENIAKLRTITKKPLIPSEKELENNPASRSAKFRVAEKI